MKKVLSIVLTLVLCLSLCACGSSDNSTTAPNESNMANSEDGSRIEVAYSEPITIMDNDTVKIVATAKFSEYDEVRRQDIMGYAVTIENKSDKYLMMGTKDCSIDGFMTDTQAGLYFDPGKIAPEKKANGRLFFFLDRMSSVEVKSLDDMKNVDGSVYVWLYEGADGPGCGNVTEAFANILP